MFSVPVVSAASTARNVPAFGPVITALPSAPIVTVKVLKDVEI
jgi:hypothetical protein